MDKNAAERHACKRQSTSVFQSFTCWNRLSFSLNLEVAAKRCRVTWSRLPKVDRRITTPSDKESKARRPFINAHLLLHSEGQRELRRREIEGTGADGWAERKRQRKRERRRDLQKINRVSCFKGGGTHRHSIVQANYRRQIITADGSSVQWRAAEQMMKCERRGGGVKLPWS